MIKKTLHFASPAYLSKKDMQLVVKKADGSTASVPISDVGVLILESPQITITHALLQELLANNAAVISCDDKHLPTGLMLNLSGNTLQSVRFRHQIEAGQALKKRLWAQTVKAKIENQALHLEMRGINADTLWHWAREVQSGDKANLEGAAAAFYWKNIFSGLAGKAEGIEHFHRDPEGMPPNHLLNYVYAVLRAIVARGLTASGLLPTLGIFHRNQYNAYCLADDVMEPFRPFADKIVYEILASGNDNALMTKDEKARLLRIATEDIVVRNRRSPLMVGLQQTTNSLYRCFSGEEKEIIFPKLIKTKRKKMTSEDEFEEEFDDEHTP